MVRTWAVLWLVWERVPGQRPWSAGISWNPHPRLLYSPNLGRLLVCCTMELASRKPQINDAVWKGANM